MKRSIMVMLGCVCLLGAETKTSVQDDVENQKRRKEAQEKYLQMTGGMIIQKQDGAGIIIQNLQGQVSHEVVTNTIESIRKLTHLPFIIIKSDTIQNPVDPLALARKTTADPNANSAVMLVDIPGWPVLLVAPESSWAIVNIAPLRDGTNQEQFERRTQQELWRGVCFALGAGDSKFDKCVMNPVTTPSDLDPLFIVPYPEYLGKMATHAEKLGIKPQRPVTYRKAVEEGWAPPPKDKYQQAIWDELKADKKE